MNSTVDHTHDAGLTSWVASAQGHQDFPIQNLPFGVFSTRDGSRRVGIAIGDMILDLFAARRELTEACCEGASHASLNALLALSQAERVALRQRVSQLLYDPQYRTTIEPMLVPAAACILHLPANIGDYTDFYVGIHHAINVGKLLRPDHPLLPNYKYVPIGYHGRASTIRTSGTAAVRPKGQRKDPQEVAPDFGPSRRMDYELELGVWIGSGNDLGQPIAIADAADHIGGFCLLNDWSARDFQAWEYQPLGPFTAKNFLTTISPWIITAEAMAPFRTRQPDRPQGDPRPLPYLWDDGDQAHGALSVELSVRLTTAAMRSANMPPVTLSQAEASNMYWTVAQLVTHHTANGCSLNPGDLLGTGTISSPKAGGQGSLMELSKGGQSPLSLPNGETRGFLDDGDEISLTARAHALGRVSIGFGQCVGVVHAAR